MHTLDAPKSRKCAIIGAISYQSQLVQIFFQEDQFFVGSRLPWFEVDDFFGMNNVTIPKIILSNGLPRTRPIG